MTERKWKIIKWGSGLLSLYLDKRLRRQRKYRPFDIAIIDAVLAHFVPQPDLPDFSPKEFKRYTTLTSHTIYWHGTGRLQHDTRGGTVDVLELLLAQNGMRPFKDTFDAKQGEMVSTSLARQRMYARIYADMHTYRGAKPAERYGTPRFWAYYFIIAINIHAIKELGLWNPKARRRQEDVWREQGKKLWTVKVAKGASSTGKFFDQGSDIPGNFPILIGLRQGNYAVLKTAAYVARYEIRVGSPIPIAAFTHLEVPRAHITEVKTLLRKYGHTDLPVFAFEECEAYYARKRFSELATQAR